jgi:DNA-binding transcriptional LysR family regulator
MDLFHLEAFLAVAREGSFSAAAKVLFRTQPAVSQIIKRLEDEIGQPLFDRSSRRGVLTDAGRVLLGHAERLVSARGRALAELDDVRHARAGRLALLVNELTGLFVLPALHEFRRSYPAVQVTVQRAAASRIPSQIRDFAADIGVAGGSGSGKTTVVSRIVESLGDEQVTVLEHDRYYRDRNDLRLEERAALNYDHPDALETDLLVQHVQTLKAGRRSRCPSTTSRGTRGSRHRGASRRARRSSSRAS